MSNRYHCGHCGAVLEKPADIVVQAERELAEPYSYRHGIRCPVCDGYNGPVKVARGDHDVGISSLFDVYCMMMLLISFPVGFAFGAVLFLHPGLWFVFG